MPKSLKPLSFGAALIGFVSLAGCTPTIKVKVELAPIYAKLDVNVRLQLDKDVQALVQQNPNLF